MATTPTPTLSGRLRGVLDQLRTELCEYNDHLEAALRSRYGMSFRTFKALKVVLQIIGASAGVYAMSLGAPPLASLALITAMVTGPELLEQLIESQE